MARLWPVIPGREAPTNPMTDARIPTAPRASPSGASSPLRVIPSRTGLTISPTTARALTRTHRRGGARTVLRRPQPTRPGLTRPDVGLRLLVRGGNTVVRQVLGVLHGIPVGRTAAQQTVLRHGVPPLSTRPVPAIRADMRQDRS